MRKELQKIRQSLGETGASRRVADHINARLEDLIKK
jgi:hypothetical protein